MIHGHPWVLDLDELKMSLNGIKRVLSPLLWSWGSGIERRRLPEPPIVIGGCARSGTTMLLALLGAHPSILAFERELGFLTRWEWNRKSGGWSPSRLDRLYRELIRKRIPSTAHRWCEKSPANIRHIEKILDFYEERVRIVHIIRDPRDVCISEHPKSGKSGGYYVTPERWVNDVRAGSAYEEHPCVFSIRYEDLIRSFDDRVDELCRFLGEERVPEMDEWYRSSRVKKNPALRDGIKPLSEGSIGKWQEQRDSDREREVLEYPGVKESMEYWGYPLEEG